VSRKTRQAASLIRLHPCERDPARQVESLRILALPVGAFGVVALLARAVAVTCGNGNSRCISQIHPWSQWQSIRELSHVEKRPTA
jgi:hypothetical protein